MKQARQVTIPLEEPLPWKEAEELALHAYNSSLWYLGAYSRNSGQVREKLYAKGYPRVPTPYHTREGAVEERDYVEECIARLQEGALLDDGHYASSYVESKLRQGWGLRRIAQELRLKHVSDDLIEEVLAAVEDEEREAEALRKPLERLLAASNFQRLEPAKRRQKAYSTLLGRGFPSDLIAEALEGLPEEVFQDG